MKIQKNVSLKNYTTFRIGGAARYFIEAKSKDDVVVAIKMAKKTNLPFFVLGGASNVLVKDRGFKGMVIKLQITNYKLQINPKSQIAKIYVGAGTSLSSLILKATKNNLTGLEWAMGIPGTIGGAIRGNAGAFGKSIENVVETVGVFDARSMKIEQFKNKDCKFQYRESVFKKRKNLIILNAVLKFKKGIKTDIRKKIKDFIQIKAKTQPFNFYSAGCVFKNPKIKIKDRKILKNYPEIKEFNKNGVIGAGWLIEKCGLKGKKMNEAKISEKHANFIVNLGNAKSGDVEKLIHLAKKEVKRKFKIKLQEEIQYLGL